MEPTTAPTACVAAHRPPRDDPITVAELAQYDGSNPDKPVYVAVKGAHSLTRRRI